MSVCDGRPPRPNPEPWPADRVPKNNLERLIASAPRPPERAPVAPKVPRTPQIATWQERCNWMSDEPATKLMVDALKAENTDLRAEVERLRAEKEAPDLHVERIKIDLVELVDDSECNQACAHGSLVDGHAVYCHNTEWSDAPRKCRRTWYTGGEVRDEDCAGFKARVLALPLKSCECRPEQRATCDYCAGHGKAPIEPNYDRAQLQALGQHQEKP